MRAIGGAVIFIGLRRGGWQRGRIRAGHGILSKEDIGIDEDLMQAYLQGYTAGDTVYMLSNKARKGIGGASLAFLPSTVGHMTH